MPSSGIFSFLSSIALVCKIMCKQSSLRAEDITGLQATARAVTVTSSATYTIRTLDRSNNCGHFRDSGDPSPFHGAACCLLV